MFHVAEESAVQDQARLGRFRSSTTGQSQETPPALEQHLKQRLGTWPVDQQLEIVVSPQRDQPEWDGSLLPVLGVTSPDGAVLSLSPRLGVDLANLDHDAVLDAMSNADALGLRAALNLPELSARSGVFRWTTEPAPLPDVGEWIATADPRLPEWLRPFGEDILVAWDSSGNYAGGVGIKRHNAYGHELAVGVEPGHRGHGLARRLVSQAAQHVLQSGAVPLYVYGPGNRSSARVADAAGIPDYGWRLIELY